MACSESNGPLIAVSTRLSALLQRDASLFHVQQWLEEMREMKSRADQALTDRLREALALIDVRVLDHIVIGDGETVSFSERGML